MSDQVHSNAELTKNQSLVMNALVDAGTPLSAYTILDKLRDDGFRAPLQVYRALGKLLEAGLVHRLESINAFVACRHDECASHGQTMFMICERCDNVSEISDNSLTNRLEKLATDAKFALNGSTIELRGTCRLCNVD